jgi:hypothetical protein
MSFKSWRVAPITACVWLAAACGGAGDSAPMPAADTPSTGANAGAGAQAPTAGKAGSAAGAKAGSAGSSSAGVSGGSAGASAAGPIAVAMIESFKDTSLSGAAGAGGGSANTAGSGASGSGNKAGTGGTGSGAGFSVVYGHATFTTASSTEVDVEIEVMGCDNGKSYPVHIHKGSSCDSIMTQGGHWGAPPAPQPLPAQYAAGSGAGGAAGSGGSNAAISGHDAGHAAGSGGAVAMYRGEGIPDIKCTGTTGVSAGQRDTTDNNLLWTIGTMNETDVVGHVLVIHDGAERIACGKIELKK